MLSIEVYEVESDFAKDVCDVGVAYGEGDSKCDGAAFEVLSQQILQD